MSDRLGRLHKIITTQQWSESPQWHFHTTSDLRCDLPGHDQGQGSARASVISMIASPSWLFFLPPPPPLSSLWSSFFPLPLFVSVKPRLSFARHFQVRHLFPWECKRENKRKSIEKMSEDPQVPSQTEHFSLCWYSGIHKKTHTDTQWCYLWAIVRHQSILAWKMCKTPAKSTTLCKITNPLCLCFITLMETFTCCISKTGLQLKPKTKKGVTAFHF